MKPEAIVQSATELITDILSCNTPANELINTYTRRRRYIGSKDRRTLTDLVWSYIRNRFKLDFLYPSNSIAEKLSLIETLSKHTFPFHIQMETPEWLIPLIPNADTELPALLQPADIILRANGDRTQIQSFLQNEGIDTTPTPLSPYGLKLIKRTNIQGTSSYRQGFIEIQDEGSQCIALETGIKPGDKVLDYCAGAGGKSLILAQMMKNQGLIIAHDISKESLSELQKRAYRAKATCIHIQKPITETHFDHVVVDAPCSGTGTWRRCPDMRWKLTQDQLTRLIQTQEMILKTVAPLVKSGGFLSYMTCSLTTPENKGQIQHFLENHPEFHLIKQKQFSPALTHTDGLFIALLQKD